MNRRLLAGAAALLLLSGAAVGVHRQSREIPVDPAPASRPSGCLMLTVEIDHRGVRVLEATHKPGLGFRAPRHAGQMEFRWTLRDAGGHALADGGFDPAEVCLDPSHAGQPPHLRGCEVIPHLAHANLKVPDIGATRTIEFARRDGGLEVPLGAVALDLLPLRGPRSPR
jgi:hypothetical protein